MTTTITQNPHLTINKFASTHVPRPVGSTITYTYVVSNDGNMTMTNVNVSDIHNGNGTLDGPSYEALTTNVSPTTDSSDSSPVSPVDGIWDTLGVGDAVTFSANYTVTQHDVDYLQ